MGMSLLLFFVAAGFELGLFTIFLAHAVLHQLRGHGRPQPGCRTSTSRSSRPRRTWGRGGGRRRGVCCRCWRRGSRRGLLAFTLSIDDFVITFFVSGPGSTTLPVRIYSMIKHSKNMPMINALSAILLVVTFAAVWGSQRLTKESTPLYVS